MADVVVASIDAKGVSLIYSTYLGGTGADQPRALAIDQKGNAVITGNTASTNFPTVVPLQPRNQGGGAAVAFVSRIAEPPQRRRYGTPNRWPAWQRETGSRPRDVIILNSRGRHDSARVSL